MEASQTSHVWASCHEGPKPPSATESRNAQATHHLARGPQFLCREGPVYQAFIPTKMVIQNYAQTWQTARGKKFREISPIDGRLGPSERDIRLFQPGGLGERLAIG